MLSIELLALTLTALTTPAVVHAYAVYPRNYISPATTLASYDYIIAGGGLAGLVLASRLSDDGKTTVLVLEAGDTGDAVINQIDTPGLTYYSSLLGTSYDYSYKTVPQAGAGGRVMTWPRGKVLGGSSAVNGMYLVRPNSLEIDAWHDLISNSSNSDSWTWDSLLSSMKKSETFTPPTVDAESAAGMKYNLSSHGTSGPLHATFPAYMVPMSSAWLPTLSAAGISTSEDAYNGNNVGAFFSTSAINPSNWTRSYSKSAYIDSLPPRNNLHILANAAVTRVVFADNLTSGDQVASGVEFAANAAGAVQSVQANKEVVLAGGAVGSPQMLLVSGIGPKDILDSVNVPVKVDLPGVGQHLQDHLATGISWETTAVTQGTIYESNSDLSKTREFLSFVNSGTCYVNGSFLFNGDDSYATFLAGLKTTLNSETALQPLLANTDAGVIAGYKAIYQALTEKVYPRAGLVEILLSINTAGRITIQTAIQTPLSQGRLYINSSSVFDPPVLDPFYFTHPADAVVLRQALKAVRQLSTISPLKEFVGSEITPGAMVQTDEDWENFVRTTATTEFHPGSTCAMLPRELGGVVDASLKVYGTANLRVIDGSVFPLSMSAHSMAPIYGLAEKAAEFILNPSATSSSSSANGSATTVQGASQTGTKGNTGVAIGSGGHAQWVATLVCVGVRMLLSSF